MKKLILVFIAIFTTCYVIGQKVSPNDLLTITQKQIENEEWEKAEHNLTELLKIYPNNTGLLFKRGFVREMNFKYRECISDFTRAIAFNPNMHTARTNRGFAYRKLGEYSKAIADFTAELEINPNPYSYEHRSYAYYLTEDFEKALVDVNISIEKDSINSISYKTRALIYMAMGLKQEACAEKNKAVELKILEEYPNYGKDITELNEYCAE